MDNKIIINVGRQLGSGGYEIAQILAKEFNAKLLDRELLNLAAKESGFSETLFKKNDEHRGFLHHLFHQRAPHMLGVNFYESSLSPESLFKFQSDAIRKAAEEGSCVIIGRCADYILRDHKNVVNIFISANEEDRVACIAKVKMCDIETARRLIAKKEQERAQYYNYYTGKKWGDAKSYDLCINTSILGIEKTSQFVIDYVRQFMSHRALQ